MKKYLAGLALLLVAACSGSRVPAPPKNDPFVAGSHTHAYADLPAGIVRSDGTIPFTAPQQGVAPVGGTDLTTKTYVDGVAGAAGGDVTVKVTAADTTTGYLDSTLVVGSGLTKTVVSPAGNETLRLDPAFGAVAGTIAQGNDARFTDSRAPTGAAGGILTGTYPNPTLLNDRVRKDVFTTKGDLLVTWASSDVRRLAVGTDGYLLSADSTASPGVAWKSVGSVYAHTLLAHADTLAQPPIKGSIIVGNSTPLWSAVGVGTNGQILTADSTAATGVKWATSTAGDVNGPGSATDTAIVRFSGTGGKTIQNSGVTIDASNNIALPTAAKIAWNADTGISRNAAGMVEANNGTPGTLRDVKVRNVYDANGNSRLLGNQAADVAGAGGAPVRGDIIVANSTPAWTKIPKGNAWERLRMASGGNDPEWGVLPYTPITGFWKLNPAASGTAVVVPFMSTGAAVVSYFVPVDNGRITGISWHFTGTHTTGTITVRARINGTGDSFSIVSGTTSLTGLGTTSGGGGTFTAGDTLGLEYDTSGTWNGTAGTLTMTLFLHFDS